MKRETSFKIIAISLPIFLVLLLEIILRISGYGEHYPLFHKVTVENKPDYLVMNPDVARKYFKNQGFHSDNQSDLFLRTKTDSTFRIFVQGASTVVGFPFYRGASFPRMLKHRLSQTFPEKNIEVVNTGITAVNSYTLWDQTDEIIAQKPDLVIIYAGHNEYYGALGVGSASSYESYPGLVRTYLSLKNLRFFQLLENGYSKISSRDNQRPKVGETTLMEVMVREQRIPYRSSIYRAGIRQFESNMEEILAKYQKNNIPVILSTLVCNEKDVKPFISDSLIDENQFVKILEQKKSEAGDLAQRNAMAAFLLGRYYLHTTPDTAKKYLRLAKELDLLRFRAPEAINEVIVNLVGKYHLPLVNMEDIFSAHSSQGVIGDELMTEHVHPNVKGYFIMADALYHKIKELDLLTGWDNYISFDEAFQDIPVAEIDSLKGKFVVDDLKKSWPYDLSMAGGRPLSAFYEIRNPNYEQRRALDIYMNKVEWKDVMEQSCNRYEREGAYKKGLHVAQSLILEFPHQATNYQLAATMCLNLNDTVKAAYYLSKYRQLETVNRAPEKP